MRKGSGEFLQNSLRQVEKHCFLVTEVEVCDPACSEPHLILYLLEIETLLSGLSQHST